MGVIPRELPEFVENCIERRRGRHVDAGMQRMGDQGHQVVMLCEQEKALPVQRACAEIVDEPAVFIALRPAGTEQQQVKLRRLPARCLWSEFLGLLQAPPAFPPSLPKTFAAKIYQGDVRMSLIT